MTAACQRKTESFLPQRALKVRDVHFFKEEFSILVKTNPTHMAAKLTHPVGVRRAVKTLVRKI